MQNSVFMPGFQNVQNTVQTPKMHQTPIQNNTASNLQNQAATVTSLNNENDKKKKIALALAGLSAAGAAAIGITYAIRHHKTPIEILSNDKLIEKVKNAREEGFTGVIKGLLKNDDTVELAYENGKIVKSTREGAKNFVKEYSDNGVTTFDATGKVLQKLEKTKDGHEIYKRQELVKKYIKIDDNTHKVVDCGSKADPFSLATEITNEYTMKDGKIFIHKKINGEGIDTYYKDKSSLISHKKELLDKNGNLTTETIHGNASNKDVDFIIQDKYYRTDGTLDHINLKKNDGIFISKHFSEDGKQINKTIEQRQIEPMSEGWISKELKIIDKDGQIKYRNVHKAVGSNVTITEELDLNKKLIGKTKETIKYRNERGKAFEDTIIEKFDADGNLLDTKIKTEERKFLDL